MNSSLNTDACTRSFLANYSSVIIEVDVDSRYGLGKFGEKGDRVEGRFDEVVEGVFFAS